MKSAEVLGHALPIMKKVRGLLDTQDTTVLKPRDANLLMPALATDNVTSSRKEEEQMEGGHSTEDSLVVIDTLTLSPLLSPSPSPPQPSKPALSHRSGSKSMRAALPRPSAWR